MESKKNKVIGIVGGMGPQAGLALYQNIIHNTKARTDQQHLSVILIALPGDVEDRTLYIEGKVPTNPAYAIVEIIQRLIIAGSEVIGIACNTSHSAAIFDVIRTKTSKLRNNVRLVSMPVEVCNHLVTSHSSVSRVGLMTTNGIYKSGLYKTMLEARGYEVIIPDLEFQNEVIHNMIYDPLTGIKANTSCITKEVLLKYHILISFFKDNNAEAIVLGCTELSQVFNTREVEGMLIIDSNECLAKALIREATADIECAYNNKAI